MPAKLYEQDFWSRADRDPVGCWVYTGPGMGLGYGCWSKNTYAHRAAWEFSIGEIPDGMKVLHHCDNRRCIRPSHLFLGTSEENTQDMIKKGRGGNCRPPVVLTEESVRFIRSNPGRSVRSLAKELGVGEQGVWYAKKGLTWKKVI